MKSEFPRQIVLSVSAGVTHFVASGLVLIVGIASLVSWGTGAGLAWLAMGLAYIAVSGWFFWCSRDTQERIELAADHLRIRRPSAPLFLRERDSIIPREDIDRIVL
ncbi:hypothetical protein HQ520_14400 [bacterium]|nr:hypothetical protein [bacterium]